MAQDWNDYQPNTKSPLFIQKYSRLGILKARQTLREWFLSLDYDYIIMCDDDAIIQVDNDHAHLDYIKCIEDHPDGFAFIHGKGSCIYTPYADSQLNLCAISKKIYTEVPMPQADPQLSQAFEDRLFSTYLHFAHRKDEFEFPVIVKSINADKSITVVTFGFINSAFYETDKLSDGDEITVILGNTPYITGIYSTI